MTLSIMLKNWSKSLSKLSTVIGSWYYHICMMSYNRRKCVKFIGEETYLISWQTTWTKQSAGRLSACILHVLSPKHSFVSICWHRMYGPSITLELCKLWLSILRIIIYFQFSFSHATCTSFCRQIHVCQPWEYVTGCRSLCPLNLAGTLIFKSCHCIWISKIIIKHYHAIHVKVTATQILQCYVPLYSNCISKYNWPQKMTIILPPRLDEVYTGVFSHTTSRLYIDIVYWWVM